ncbi:hypothetical protein JCM30566_06390 [Marinitoga arctica]
MRDIDGYYKYIAVKGHNMEFLKKISFSSENIYKEKFHSTHIIKTKVEREDPEQLELLVKGGNLLKIKTYLSVPIIMNDKNIGFLNIDNYTDKNIFTDEIISLSKSFANFISIAYSSILKRKKLLNKAFLLKKSNIENNGTYTKDFIFEKAEEFFNLYEEFIFLTARYKNFLDDQNVLSCLIDRVNNLFPDDYISFEKDTFFILSNYISEYFFKTEVKKILSKPIFWENKIIPNFEYFLYKIPEDIKNINELKEVILL